MELVVARDETRAVLNLKRAEPAEATPAEPEEDWLKDWYAAEYVNCEDCNGAGCSWCRE